MKSHTGCRVFVVGAAITLTVLVLAYMGGIDRYQVQVTCSMYHDASFDEWWREYAWKYGNITKDQFASFPFPDGLTQVDGRLQHVNASDIDVGDVLVFDTYSDPPMIGHRVIAEWSRNWTHNWTDIIKGVPHARARNVSTRYFSTLGDYEFVQMPFERRIEERQVVGKVVQGTWRNILRRVFVGNPCRESAISNSAMRS